MSVTFGPRIALPGAPNGIVFNTGVKKLYLGCSTRDDAGITTSAGIAVVDDTSKTVVANIPTSQPAFVLAANGTTKRVYLGEYRRVAVIDATTDTRLGAVTVLDAGTAVEGLAVDEAHNRVYAVSSLPGGAAGRVDQIDGATNAVLATWMVPVRPLDRLGARGNHTIAIDPVQEKLFVLGSNAAYQPTTVTIDTRTGTVGAPVTYANYGVGRGSDIKTWGPGNAIITLLGAPAALQVVDPQEVPLPAGFVPTNAPPWGERSLPGLGVGTSTVFGSNVNGLFLGAVAVRTGTTVGVSSQYVEVEVPLQFRQGFPNQYLGPLFPTDSTLDANGDLTFNGYFSVWPDPVTGGPELGHDVVPVAGLTLWFK